MALLVLLAAPARLSAAGFWLLERGASTYARGGANVADPGDPSAAVYLNPAGLAGLSGLQLQVDTNLVMDGRTFARAPDDLDGDGELTDYELAENRWSPSVPSPSVFAAFRFASVGLPELAVGAGVWGPPLVDRDWDPEGAQRYSEIAYSARQVQYALAAAVALPWAGLRLGATGMLVDQRVRTSLKLSTATTFGALPERPENDVLVAIDATDGKIFTGVLGVSAAPTPWLVLAASYQPPYNARAKGTAEVVLGEELAGLAEVSGDKIRIALDFPAIGRVAARLVDPQAQWDVELAWVWEGWSRVEKTRFIVDDLSVVIPGRDVAVSDVDIRQNFRDTWSARLGGSYVLLPEQARLRAGAYYERAAVAKEWVSPAAFELDKVGASVGGRVELPAGVWIDAALGVTRYLGGEVTGSKQRMPNVLPAAGVPDELWSVTNGTYENQLLFVMLAAGIELDV